LSSPAVPHQLLHANWLVHRQPIGCFIASGSISFFSFPFPPMSVRLYVGNLPQSFDAQELEALFTGVGEGVRFKPVVDRETGECRGFGFANVDDQKQAEAVISALNGRQFGGNALRIEVSERKETRTGGADRRSGGNPTPLRQVVNKVVHADQVNSEAPDPRWAGELAKLKQLLDNQKATV
jgi:RNA recognition motif-containing protein